jgi:hypothetical protein
MLDVHAGQIRPLLITPRHHEPAFAEVSDDEPLHGYGGVIVDAEHVSGGEVHRGSAQQPASAAVGLDDVEVESGFPVAGGERHPALRFGVEGRPCGVVEGRSLRSR